MEIKEVRVDTRNRTKEESLEAIRQEQLLFEINHTMPMTEGYANKLKELFQENLGEGSIIRSPIHGACVSSTTTGVGSH